MESSKKKDWITNVDDALNKLVDDMLQVCKPLSVNMTRLPTSVVNKYAATSSDKAKKKNRVPKSRKLWRRGYTEVNQRHCLREHRRKILRLQKLQSEKQNTMIKEDDTTQSKQISEIQSKDLNPQDEESPTERTAADESQELNIELTSNGHEAPLIPELRNELPNPSIDAAEKRANNIPVPCSEQIDNRLSRKHSLRHALSCKNDEDRVIVRVAGKRKRSLQTNGAEMQESQGLLEDTKKHKSGDGAAVCNEKTSPEEGNIGYSFSETSNKETPENVSAIGKHVKLAKLKKNHPKSVRRRIDCMTEARVVMTRLEDSIDPLVLQWREKIRLQRSSDSDVTTCTTPIEKRIEEKTCLAATDESSKQKSPVKETFVLSIIDDTGPVVSTNVTQAATSVDAMPETNTFTPLDEETRTSEPATEFEEQSIADDDENDEEIMEFLRSPRKIRPSIESSSSESISYFHDQEARKTPSLRRSARSHTMISSIIDSNSDSDEIPMTRTSRSRVAKTSSIIKSSPERTRPETRMSRLLRLANTPAIDDMDSETTCNESKTPKTPLLRQSATRNSINKSRRLVVDDTSSESTYNPGEALTDMFDDDITSPMPTEDRNSLENPINIHRGETDEGCRNLLTNKTPIFTNSPYSQEDNTRLAAIAEVNCDSSIIDDLSDSTNPASSHHNEVLIARKKLTALNAMVVLTRLEDLDDISDSGMEFRTAEDCPWMTSFSSATMDNPTYHVTHTDSNSNDSRIPADPLEINEDNQSSTRDIDTPISGLSSRRIGDRIDTEATAKSSPKKSSRIEHLLQEDTDTRWSQDTAESDVELSLVLEDGDKTCSESIGQTQTSGTRVPSVNSICTVTDGILTDANGNSPRHGHNHEDLDVHRKRCLCDDHQRDKHRLTCQNIAATHKCVTCNALFTAAELLEQHKTSSVGCNVDLRCATCQATYKTASGLAKHRTICAEKVSEKRRSVDETSNNEAETDSQTEQDASTESSAMKSKQKKSQMQKKLPKKGRTKIRARGDPPICNVCSINFVTTQALSEHIYKHSSEELQEAFRIRKANMMVDSRAARSATDRGEIDSNNSAKVDGADSSQQKFTEDASSAIQTNARTINNAAANNDPIAAMVCPCHREDQANADKNDLQIEMVLVCRYCQVLFRRRECFEVHYRTSPRCANDRTQGRCPRLFCANCQLTLDSWKDMRHHLEVHASENAEGTVRFVCNICRVVFVGFGALFYYHWVSHRKDIMFVASRYTFPKNSVQPIDGMAKLPIGASSEESYIWVAEHVCAECKKPFSTRPDLVLHQETDTCCSKVVNVAPSKVPVDNTEAQWYCDVCDLTFENRDKLNEHGVACHGRHYTCVSTSPKQKTFMCTKCCAMRKRIKDIEEHWKTHPQHNSCRFDMETNTETNDSELAVITPLGNISQLNENSSSANDSRVVRNSSLNTSTMISNDTTESDEMRKCKESATKTAENKEVSSDINIVFQASVDNPQSQSTTFTDNQKSSIASTQSDEPAIVTASVMPLNRASTVCRNNTSSTTKSPDKQRTRIGALEDPCVTVVMSDSSSTNLSASLVIDESYNKTSDDSITESYQILMMDNNPKSTSGPIKMVFGRKSAGNAAEKMPEPGISESLNKLIDKRIADKSSVSKSISVGERKTTSVAQECLHKDTAVVNSSGAKTSRKTVKTKSYSSNISKDNEVNLSRPASMNNQSVVPEVIEIVEEVELSDESSQAPGNVNSSSGSKVPAAKSTSKGKTGSIRNKKSSVIKMNKGVASKKKSLPDNSLASEINSNMILNDSGRSEHSDGPSFARRESNLSFEEARYAAHVLSKNSTDDVAVTKKQGFLRVKNLSELQAVRKHVCQICNANFETIALLDEHSKFHLQTSFGKFAKNRRGTASTSMFADPGGRTKITPVAAASTNLTQTPAESCISQRHAGLRSTTVGNGTNDILGSGGSWICIPNQSNTTMSNSVLNIPSSLGTLLSDYSLNNDAAKSVITSTASIAQPQESFANQSQTLNSTGGYIAMSDIHRQLPDSRNTGQIGYHILPAMVVPSSQSSRQQQQTNVASQQNSSSNNLPASGLNAVSTLNQPSMSLHKFACNICTTFQCDTIEAFNEHITKHLVGFNNTNATQTALFEGQPAVSTVIVPQASSFRTVNETIPNGIAENTAIGAKNTSDRLVVNNWILQNASIGWPNTTFNQQSASSVLPISTQSLLTTTVQTSNSNGTNTAKSSSIWSPPNSNNNNSTNTLKQRSAWLTTTFTSSEVDGGQVVYQCKLCKSAMYNDYEHLRRHILVVHGVENFLKSRIENIVQKNYHCSRCPSGAAPFESALKLRLHQNTGHPNVCPYCHRTFYNYAFLTDHTAHCRSSTHGNFDSNC